MGALAALIPILGILAGIIIAYGAHTEIRSGKKYFLLLQHALIAIIAGVLLVPYARYLLVIPLVLFLILWKTKISHPLAAMPLLAIASLVNPQTQIPIFLYFIPTASLHEKEKGPLLVMAIGYVVIVFIAQLPI